MGSTKKPKKQGKNRIYTGDLFGFKISPGMLKTWEPTIRKAFGIGLPKKSSAPLNKDK